MKDRKNRLLTAFLTLLTSVMLLFCVSCGDNKPTLKFNTNGGDAIASVKVDTGATYELPEPTKEGYSFEGWYTKADFSGDPVTEIVVGKDTTVYAKWEQMYEITVELDGGSLTLDGKLYLKADEVIYDFMETYVPTKDGVEFGAWYMGEDELSKTAKMPEENITLTAKYKVAYTVEIWEQKLDLKGYEKREEDIIGYEYAGVDFVSEQVIVGFKEVIKDNTVSEKTISETASENVFRHYFDREVYEVVFNTNYPSGWTNAEISVEKPYGVEIEVPSDYVLEGYCLLGWATSPSGEVVYKSNYIEKSIYGNKNVGKADVVMPERDMALYAVWLKGYVDMFGNDDYIFLFEEEIVNEETNETTTEYSIYLYRGGVLFEGEYKANKKKFSFENSKDKTLLEGKLNDNGTYVYSDLVRADYAFSLLNFGVGIDTSVKAYFDEYDGITYATTQTIAGKDVSVESTGTYYIDNKGYYIATFTDGALAGKTLTMIFGSVTDETGKEQDVFQVRNDEEYNMGKLVRFAAYQSVLTYYTAYDVTLDGFNTAYMNTGNSRQTYYYQYDAETKMLTFLDTTYFRVTGVAEVKEMSILGKMVKGYAVYASEYDKTYTFDGGKLTLDGYFNATIEKNGQTSEGLYMLEQSLLGGIIVNVYTKTDSYKFLVTTVNSTVTEGGQTTTQVTYKAEEKLETYAEYYYETAGKVSEKHILIVNDKQENMAALYGMTDTGEFFEVSRGTLVYDATTGLYTYTVTKFADLDVELIDNPIDFTNVEMMVCALDSETMGYRISYWYSYKTNEGESPVDLSKEYTAGSATLTLVSGVAIYKANGEVIIGFYETNDKTGITTVTASNKKHYFELNETGATFVKLEHAPYNAYLLGENGESYDDKKYLTFDGKGGVTYTVVNGTEKTVYVGTMEKTTKTTLSGAIVYKFYASATDTLPAVEFEYIDLYASTKAFFAKQSTLNGTFLSQKDGVLKIDGYAYWAVYVDQDGNAYEGKYYVDSQTIIRMEINSIDRFFDISGTSFTLRGEEYGTYIYINNQYANGIYFDFDGYGKLSVYVMVDPDGDGTFEKQPLTAKDGTYEFIGNDIVLTYTEIGATKATVLTGSVGSYSGYPVFMENMKEGIAGTYVNGNDFTVLILDQYGNAARYLDNGIKQYGTYNLISDTLLFYLSTSGASASLYNYNTQTRIATEVTSLEARGYYTEALESLIFTEYGFAVFGGTSEYYYEIDDDNVVWLYRQAQRGEQHNGYGFVKVRFGEYEKKVTYDNKVYFATDGYEVMFKRVEATADKYPVAVSQTSKLPLGALSFQPNGAGEFTVKGIVLLGEQDYECYVTRAIKDNGDVEMYIMVYSTVGYYRFDIALAYYGDNNDGTSNNTYEVTGYSLVISTLSYEYLTRYYVLAMLGVEYANNFGEIDIVIEYNEAGEEANLSVDAAFYSMSSAYNTKGEMLSASKASLYDVTGKQLTFADLVISDSYIYRFDMQSEGYTYHLYFTISEHPYYSSGMFAYTIFALTREETLTYDGYKVVMERVVTSEADITVGYPLVVTITKGEGESLEEYKWESWFRKDGFTYFVVRETDADSGLITKTLYFKLKLVEQTISREEQETNHNPLQPYDTEQFVLTVEEMETRYTSDKDTYVDINKTTNKIMLLAFDDEKFVVSESNYDETTNTYTIRANGVSYTVKVEQDGSVTVTEIVATQENA